MAKDKINKLIKEIIEMQEHRQDSKTNMHLKNVRVVFSGQEYYANVEITKEAIIIKPHDEEIPVTYFLPVHLRGYSEVDNRGLIINQRFNRPSYRLYFRTPPQCARALKRIRVVTGEESTSESSEN
nr:PREDICTED: uncharacterized protein LOC103313701 [Tribolium castaneum]|eukprot:XP_008195893.1 PREDICTED: uncharacterized protein LOC103313701 [Tribolium castaneum]